MAQTCLNKLQYVLYSTVRNKNFKKDYGRGRQGWIWEIAHYCTVDGSFDHIFLPLASRFVVCAQ